MKTTWDKNEGLMQVAFYTRNTFDIWQLAGPGHAKTRARILSHITGKSVPQSAAGINKLRATLYDLAGISDGYDHAREQRFVTWAQHETKTTETAP